MVDPGGHCRAFFAEKSAKAPELCAVGGCGGQAFVSVFSGKLVQPDTKRGDDQRGSCQICAGAGY